MSDLTDEEIIATRKLHGLNDDLFKEGTDTNVGSINKIMERLNFLIIDLKSTKKVNEIITEEGKLNLAKDIETALNMLKEKDKEIEMLKDIKEIADTKVTELRKIKEVDRLESENWILQVKLQDKDKMIDLMAEFIYAMWCDYPGSFTKALRNGGFDDKECGTCESKEKNCLDCLKQYFKNKAEKE